MGVKMPSGSWTQRVTQKGLGRDRLVGAREGYGQISSKSKRYTHFTDQETDLPRAYRN